MMVNRQKVSYSNIRQEVADNHDHPITEETWHIKEISLEEQHTKHTIFHFGNDFHRPKNLGEIKANRCVVLTMQLC